MSAPKPSRRQHDLAFMIALYVLCASFFWLFQPMPRAALLGLKVTAFVLAIFAIASILSSFRKNYPDA